MTDHRPPLGFRSLQARLQIGAVVILLVVMAAVFMVVEYRQSSAIVDEVQRRGEVIARSLAALSTGPLLLYNFTALEQNVSRVAREPDVVYAMILDADGLVASHSRHPELAGTALHAPVDRLAAKTQTFLIQEAFFKDTRESIYDLAVPIVIEGQRWGTVRVGLSKRRMQQQIRATRWELGALTLVTVLLGSLGAAVIARRIARPVRELADRAAAISRGELTQHILPTSSDEIGQLGIAFNHMVTQLFLQRTALETTHADLQRHFEQLADLKSYTDSILESLTSGIITLDLDGRVVTMNPAAELLTGLFAPEATGRFCTEVLAHSPEVVEVLMETLSRRTGVATTSLPLRKRNGAVLPIELSTAPLRGADGKERGVLGVFKDLTVVRELEAQLRRSDRLAALGTLAAGLAHEIKNPLTSLRTFTRVLSRRFNDERFRQTFERVVPHELERINGIVERLLELARPGRLTLQPVRVPALVDRVLELYAHQIEANQITVRREYGDDLSTIQADGEQLYRAFLNIIANAIDAMRSGGVLTVRAHWSADAGWRGLSRLAPERTITIEVEDTGTGILPSDADKIFNPFFTTKNDGTGLGLALAHKIVEDHGGTISFRSVTGTGTTFQLALPAIPGHVARVRRAGERHETNGTGVNPELPRGG